MSYFFTDTFVATAGTLITAHTSDSGSTYSILTGSNFDSTPGDTWEISPSGQCCPSTTAHGSASGQGLVTNATPNSANYGVLANVNSGATFPASSNFGIGLRASSGSTDTSYCFVYITGSGWRLLKRVAGAVTLLGSSYYTGFTPTSGTAYTIGIEANGTTITGFINGTSVATATDSSITQVGSVNFLAQMQSASGPGGGLYFTELRAYNLAADQFAFTGPSTVTQGTASSNFTVNPDGEYTGTISLSDGGAGGTFTPSSLTFSGGQSSLTPQTFTYTAATTGSITITPSASPTVTNGFSPASITVTSSSGGAATSMTFSGPSSGTVGVASTNFTLTPNGTYTGTVSLSDGGAGGTFTPTSLSWSSSSSAETFSYTPATTGAITITPSASPTLSSGISPTTLTYTSNPTSATSMSFTGPSTGTVGVASSNFTLIPNGSYTGTVSLSDGGAGGTFTPTSLSWSASSSAMTFTYTAASTGAKTITPTASPTLSSGISPTTLTFTASSGATSYTLTGPSSGNDGVASTNFTVTPNASYTGTITPATSGSGTFTPTSLSWSSSSTAKTFTYTPSTAVGSPHSISTTSSPSLTNPSPISYTVIPGSITLTSPTNYQTFQRSGVTGTIMISGTNGDTATHSIQASWNGNPYVTIASNVTGGATFTGTLTSQPQGQGTLTVRFVDLPSDATTVSNVGIGDIYVIAGQSNAVGQITTDQVSYHQTLVATMFALNYTWEAASDPIFNSTGQVDPVPNNNGSGTAGHGGTYWMTLATYLMATTGVPIAFIPAAQDGAGLVQAQSGTGYWWNIPTNHLDRTTLYGAMNYRSQLVGGIKAVLWHQGETDAINGSSASAYSASLIALAQAIKTDLNVPVIAAIFQTCTASSPTLAAQQAIWTGIRQAAGTPNSNVILGPNLSLMTADSSDGLHLVNQADAFEAAAMWSQILGVVKHRWTH